MVTSDFRYYVSRSQKQRAMAQAASSPKASDAHMQLAKQYAGRAALAAMKDE